MYCILGVENGKGEMDKGKECMKIGVRMVKGGEDYERLERNCVIFLRICKFL